MYQILYDKLDDIGDQYEVDVLFGTSTDCNDAVFIFGIDHMWFSGSMYDSIAIEKWEAIEVSVGFFGGVGVYGTLYGVRYYRPNDKQLEIGNV